MLKLIVHADDFGLSEKTNEGILKAYRDGIVTSTSIMANGAAFEGAIEICRENEALDVGVHLTLVEEIPVLPENQVASLVGREGRMADHARQFTKKYFLGSINLGEVRDELEAQIKKVMSSGIQISHLDSHQHLHMLPRILPIVISLAERFNIPYIRLPMERLRWSMLNERNLLGRIVQMMVLNTFCFLGRKMVPSTTDYFCGFLYGGNLNKINLGKTLEALPSTGMCELMCHPGISDSNSNYKHWGYHQEEEMKALCDMEISEIILRKRIELVPYRSFANNLNDSEK